MPSTQNRRCTFCNNTFSARGLGSHEKSCRRKVEDELRVLEADSEPSASASPSRSQSVQFEADNALDQVEVDQVNDWEDIRGVFIPRPPSPETPVILEPTAAEIELDLQLDDIKTEYHENSGLPCSIQRFDDYGADESKRRPTTELRDEAPWRPFRTRLDFEVAELAHQAALNEQKTNQLFDLMRRSADGCNSNFTLKDHKEVRGIWNLAAYRRAGFRKVPFDVEYKKGDVRTFEVIFRPLWDWAMDLITDERLRPHFVWDAQRLYKYNGAVFERFYHEPWTADRFWNIQSRIPAGGKIFGFILYADKTKLSSFGTAKGYPVIARCANLPVEIRNGDGLGGGRVVGWLPVIDEDPKESGKKGWANFKCIVWHEAFVRFLDSIRDISKVGHWHEFVDGEKWWLWPLILILSADYEEQSIMTLIRGVQGLYPCPVCLIPWDQLSNLSVRHVLRTAEQTQGILQEADAAQTQETAEELLKDYGLRYVKNSMWTVKNSDPHKTTSWDHMHAYAGGLWDDHIWKEIKGHLNRLGDRAAALVDTIVCNFPRWRGLNRFKSVTNISFTDASKNRDISKIIIFALHNVLDEASDPQGYRLLKVLRSYLELDLWADLDVHTSATLESAEGELLRFSALLKEYADSMDGMTTKNWNFPKAHTHQHAFADVRAKGATRNFVTKYNEKQHGPLKKAYLGRTNFKDFSDQILRADHTSLIAEVIREELTELDSVDTAQPVDKDKDANEDEDDYEDDYEDAEPEDMTPIENLKYHIGASQRPQTLADLEHAFHGNAKFERFRLRLSAFLNSFFQIHNIPLPDGKHIKLAAETKIIEYRFLKVHYESKVDWRKTSDYLRRSPCFHQHPRDDCVLIKTVDGVMFAQLLLLFACTVDKKVYHFALIHPFDAHTGPLRRKDKDLNFYRVREKNQNSSEFVSVNSIIRGALLVGDSEKDRDKLVVDTIDPDMFLRMKELFPRLR